MPVIRCQKDSKPGYKWGKSGHCYTYTPSNEKSRQRAMALAQKQGEAIRATGWKEK